MPCSVDSVTTNPFNAGCVISWPCWTTYTSSVQYVIDGTKATRQPSTSRPLLPRPAVSKKLLRSVHACHDRIVTVTTTTTIPSPLSSVLTLAYGGVRAALADLAFRATTPSIHRSRLTKQNAPWIHLLNLARDTAEASTAYGRFTALTLADAHDKTARFISFPSLPSENDAGPVVEEPEGRRARGVAAAKTTSYKARRPPAAGLPLLYTPCPGGPRASRAAWTEEGSRVVGRRRRAKTRRERGGLTDCICMDVSLPLTLRVLHSTPDS